MFDWDGVNKTFESVIQYYCEKAGWGYPSNGQSEQINFCQADKTWNLTEIENCVCKFKCLNFAITKNIKQAYFSIAMS